MLWNYTYHGYPIQLTLWHGTVTVTGNDPPFYWSSIRVKNRKTNIFVLIGWPTFHMGRGSANDYFTNSMALLMALLFI